MLSRALTLAAVTLLIGCFGAVPARAQAQKLEAGKSPSQIFAGTCSACHKSPRGLLKTVPAGSLPGFLRQHYTTSSDMASLLSAFLVSNGAADTRYVGTQSKPDAKQDKDSRQDRDARQSRDAKPEARPAEPVDRFGRRLRPAPFQEAVRPDAEVPQAAKPDADGPPQAEPGRHGRNAKRLARPAEAPDVAKPAADARGPTQAAGERGPDGRKLSAKLRLSKRGKPGSEEPPKADTGKDEPYKDEPYKDEPYRGEPAKEDKPPSDTAKYDEGKPEDAKPRGEGMKPPGEGKSEAGRIEPPKPAGSGEPPALRADPVPPVTPAPQRAPTVSSGTPEEPTAASSAPPAPSPPPAMTASVPPSAPVAPAGPPAPPISQ